MSARDEGTDRPLCRALLWRSLRGTGLEYCGLWRYAKAASPFESGWALRGTAVTEFDGVPAEARYRVVCDDSWRTRRVHVGVIRGEGKAALRLEGDGNGRWRSNGQDVPQFAGSLDVDLGIGASTNTLPICRLKLPVGGHAEIVAAWVRFPDLSLEPLPQRYTRLAEDRYRYESLDSGFTAEIQVDELGLAIHYSGWCERVAMFDPFPTLEGPTDRGVRPPSASRSSPR